MINKTIVGIGEILWDILPSGKQLGGAPTNFAYHAHELGAKGIVASCLGNDVLGDEILKLLDSIGIDQSFLSIDKKHKTGLASVVLDENGLPSFTIHEDVAWDYLRETPQLLQLASVTDAVSFGSLAQRSALSRRTIHSFLHNTPENSLRIFDINLRQHYYSRDIIISSLMVANVLKLNEQELSVVTKMLNIQGDQITIFRILSECFGLNVIALTKGKNGSDLFTQGVLFSHEGYEVDSTDTVGAGDAFTTALAIGFLKGLKPGLVNVLANRLASFVCTQTGATPKTPNEIKALFHSP